MAFDKLAYDRAWRNKNRDRIRVRTKEWRDRNRDHYKAHMRNYHINRKYGLTSEAFEQKFKEQGSCCAACNGTDPGHKNGWHVDHNHTTGATRGIVCAPCNLAIGLVEKAYARALIALTYLEKYDET